MEPDHGMLDVGDGHRLRWEQSGNPRGVPLLVLHGGPGSGSSVGLRRLFDADRFLVVEVDQRNCGRSIPYAGDPTVDLTTNTTAHLVADCEHLREHLGIARWMVWGGSWGAILGLAYAEAHPERVTSMVLVSVPDHSRRQVEWMMRSMGRVFPREHDRFLAGLPPERRDGDLAAAYAVLLHDADPDVRHRAARSWCEWEDTHVATYPGHVHDPRYDDPGFRLCFARIVTHYWSNGCFLDEGQLLRDVGRLAGIPAVVVNGRLDISSPPDFAVRLADAWPRCELVLVDAAGHGAGHAATADAVRVALERMVPP